MVNIRFAAKIMINSEVQNIMQGNSVISSAETYTLYKTNNAHEKV